MNTKTGVDEVGVDETGVDETNGVANKEITGVSDKTTGTVDEVLDFKICRTPEEALESKTTKFYLLTILRVLCKDGKIKHIYDIYKKFIESEEVSLREIELLEEIIKPWDEKNLLIEMWDTIIKNNLLFTENDCRDKITTEKLLATLEWLITQVKIKDLLNKPQLNSTPELYNSTPPALKRVQEMKEKNIIFENEYVFVLRELDDLDGEYFILDRKTWNKFFCYEVKIDKENWFIFFSIWLKKWCLNLEWKSLIPLEYDIIEYDSKYWFKVKKWQFCWILDRSWKQIINVDCIDIKFVVYWFLISRGSDSYSFYNLKWVNITQSNRFKETDLTFSLYWDYIYIKYWFIWKKRYSIDN